MQQEATVLCLDASVPLIWEDTIDDARAWKRETITPEDWLVPLPQACLAELDAIAEFVRTYPVPAWYQQPDNLPLDACRQAMADIRERLKHGHGFAILDRVPVERYSVTENKAIGWILASLLAQVVAQKWDGTLLYDVQDSGKPLGHGVRRSVTNLEQDFHTDGGWLWLPPSAIGLFCLQPALHGGLSRVVSLFAVHNTMLRRYPDLLARLYQPFWWDRQAEHAADDRCVNRHPIFRYDDHTLMARYYEDYVHKGARLAGEELDAEGAAALAAMRSIVDDPDNWLEFRMEQGQLQYVNNRQFAHARTAFDDTAGVRSQRHMLRLWNRPEGSPALEGQGDTI